MLRSDAGGVVRRGRFLVDEVDLGPVVLRRGDVFHEHYAWGRWFVEPL